MSLYLNYIFPLSFNVQVTLGEGLGDSLNRKKFEQTRKVRFRIRWTHRLIPQASFKTNPF